MPRTMLWPYCGNSQAVPEGLAGDRLALPQLREDCRWVRRSLCEVHLTKRDDRLRPVAVEIVRVMIDQLLVGRVRQRARDPKPHLLDELAADRRVGQVQPVLERFPEQQFIGDVVTLDPRNVVRSRLAPR